VARAKISDDIGSAAVAAVLSTDTPSRTDLATAVRYTLQLLAIRAEGNTVEVRVPPFGAVQCIAGPRHTRGTPPNVVETDAATWMQLATGAMTFARAVETARVQASGTRADISEQLPIAGLPAGRPIS
jgi:hypothetical protein